MSRTVNYEGWPSPNVPSRQGGAGAPAREALNRSTQSAATSRPSSRAASAATSSAMPGIALVDCDAAITDEYRELAGDHVGDAADAEAADGIDHADFHAGRRCSGKGGIHAA